MSWVVEEWKEGLSTKVLQKIQEIELQRDKLKKERQQRQFQVETLEAALLKQKQKVENEKSEASALKRECQTLNDSCDNLEKTKQKISHELQLKESQMNYLKSQLVSSKKHVENLEQENKRYRSEFERCQTNAVPADVSFGTPEKKLSVSPTPKKIVSGLPDSKYRELQEKYNKEVEERSRLERQLDTIQAKLVNQPQPQNSISQRNVARHPSTSAVFPWQQDQTPSQHSLKTPLKGVAMNFQWEQEETPFKHHPKSLEMGTHSTGRFSNTTDSSKQVEQLKLQNQELQTKVLDLESRFEAKQKEVKNHLSKLVEIQFQFEKTKSDLFEKERKLSKCHEELAKMTGQCEQSNSKCAMVEKRLKHVSDELNCCRQNAESTRCNVEQKLKDKEKELQEEVSHHQHNLQSADQQMMQTKNKLNQELQQAKKEYNVLQLDVDRLSACKQKLEKEMDEVRQQLHHSDQLLKAKESKENNQKKKLEDVQEERNSLRSQLLQNSTNICKLKNELQTVKQDFTRTSNCGEDMKNKNIALDNELKGLRQQRDEQSKSSCMIMENLKIQIAHLKKEQEQVQKFMKEKDRNIEQLNTQIATMENKSEDLQKQLQLKEKTCHELKQENSSLAQWKAKNTQALDGVNQKTEGMENKIKELEQSLELSFNKNGEHEQYLEIYRCKIEKQSETLNLLEDEKETLRRQTDELKQMLDSKTLELEKQEKAFDEFKKMAKQDEHEVEKLNVNISQLTSQIAELDKILQQETNKVVKLEESQCVFKAEYENVSNVAKSKDCLIELKETEILNLTDKISQITHNFEEQLVGVNAEKTHLMEDHEKSMLDKVEVEIAKSALENEIVGLKEQITSQDSLLKLETRVQSELQNKYDVLIKIKKELEEKIMEAGKKGENLRAGMEEEINKLKMQHVVLQAAMDEKDISIQNFAQELESNMTNLKCLQITNKELETKLECHLLLEKSLQEKEELICSKGEALGQLSEENDELKTSINNLLQENVELNQKNSSFDNIMKVQEEMVEELAKCKQETAIMENIVKSLNTLCEELTDKQRLLESTVEDKENETKQLLGKVNEREGRVKELEHECMLIDKQLKDLQGKCTATEETKNFLEEQLNERAHALLIKNAEVEDLEKKCTEDSNQYNDKIVGYEEKITTLVEEIGDLLSQLEKTKEVDHLKKELAESMAIQNKVLEDYNQLLRDKEELTHLVQAQGEKENAFAARIENLENDLVKEQSEIVNNKKLIEEKNIVSDQLRDTIKTKEIELQRIQAQLQLLQMDLEDKEASSETCVSQLEQLQTDTSILESKFQSSEEERDLLEMKVSTMQEEMETMRLRISESSNKEESLLGEICQQRQTIEELKRKFEKQEKDLHFLESQLYESQMQCHLKEGEILELQEKVSSSETYIIELMNQKSNIEFQLQELTVQMHSDLSNVKNTLQQSEEQRVILQQNLSKVQSDLQRSDEQSISVRQELAKVQSELQQSDEHRVILQHNISKVQSELQHSEEKKVILQQDLNVAQSELQQSAEQRICAQQDLRKVQSELQHSEEQRVILQHDLSVTQSELHQNEEQKVILQQDLSVVHSELQHSEEQRVILQQDLSVAQSELQQSAEQRICAQQDLRKVQSKLQQNEEQRVILQQNFSKVQSELQYSEEQRVILQQDLNKVQSELQQNEEEIVILQQDLNKVRSEQSNKHLDLTESSPQMLISGCEKSMQLENKVMATVDCQKGTVLQASSLCQIDRENLKPYVEQMDKKYTEMKEGLPLLQSNLIEAQAALSGANIDKEALQSQLSMLESSLESAHLLASEQKEQMQQLEKMIQDKDNEQILLHEKLANTIVKDQDASSEDTDSKMKSLELGICTETSEQSVAQLQEQLQKLQADANAEILELQHTITTTWQALESLKEQHSSELTQWQLKFSNLTTEMEDKLAAQKQQTEMLSAELEGARVQLQSLDLSSQSLLNASHLSEENTPQKLMHSSSEKPKEMYAVEDKLECMNLPPVTIDSDVQRQEKTALQLDPIAERHVMSCDGANSFDNARNPDTDELNEDNADHQGIAELAPSDEVRFSAPMDLSDKVPSNSQVQLREEKKENTEILLGEMEGLHSDQQKELFLTAAAVTDLESKVSLLEEEKNDLSNELKSFALVNQNLSDRAKTMEAELNDVTTQLQVDKGKMFEMAKILESLEVDKRDRNEQVLELEMQLKQTKSNKANLENHILEMEVDLNKLQTEKDTLEKELESGQQSIHTQTEKLAEFEAINNKFIQDLDIAAETNDKLERTNNILKTKMQEFEAEKIYNAIANGEFEAEIKKLTNQLQTVVEQTEQVSTEKEDLIQRLQYLEKDVKLGTEGEEEFQKQLNQLKEENLSMSKQIEDLENTINIVRMEKSNILQSLESSLLERSEVAARLNSTKIELAEMRHTIEKLKVRIEADQKKSQDMAEKHKAVDRKADFLQDKIEALERELQASEEIAEDLILQAETAKEQAEVMEEEKKVITDKLELLTKDINSLSRDKQDLEKQLQKNQELENRCSDLLRSSEAAKNENLKMAADYEGSINELQTKLSHLNENVKNCNEELETLRVNEKNYFNQNSCLERETVQLANKLQEVDALNVELQSANVVLNKDLQRFQQKLDEHKEEKEKLQQQITDLEKLKQNNSTDLCSLKTEVENLKKERYMLQKAAAESQQEIQDLSAKHNAMLITKETSEKQLQKELRAAQLQASALLDQVKDLTGNNTKLQSDLSVANGKILEIQDVYTEKNSISAQFEAFRSQAESFKMQLEFSQSENCTLKKDLEYLQNELQVTCILKKQVEDYKQCISCIQKDHQSMLNDAEVKHEAQLKTYQEQMAGMKQQLTAKEVEINNLKNAKEAENNALKGDNGKVEELQISVAKLKRDKDCAQSKLLLWRKNCKKLEHEKESLKRHIQQQEEQLTKLQNSQKTGLNSELAELSAEMKELKETEEKTKETDVNMDKYYNLIKCTYKLEEENEMLKGRIALLNNELQKADSGNVICVAEQTLEVTSKEAAHKKDENKSPGRLNSRQTHLKPLEMGGILGLSCDAPMKLDASKSQKRCPDAQFKRNTKRLRGAESEEAEDEPEVAQNYLKQSRTGKAQKKTSYEPESLPEKNKKAQTRVSPRRKTPQKEVVQTCNVSKMAAEDGHIYQDSTRSSPKLLPCPMAPMPLISATNSVKKKGVENHDGEQSQAGSTPNMKKSVEKNIQPAEQTAVKDGNENCKVQ
ncbi:centromere protein F isoform X3 [Amblyraja radiata]|uniref:centromere protein F isoform X3 n=1 Tax=Amblyraja radiata TaxID=386614 RepID=UPI0014041D3D|nr:centromere protein F isoform X3 [Amblyraja radiata]